MCQVRPELHKLPYGARLMPVLVSMGRPVSSYFNIFTQIPLKSLTWDSIGILKFLPSRKSIFDFFWGGCWCGLHSCHASRGCSAASIQHRRARKLITRASTGVCELHMGCTRRERLAGSRIWASASPSTGSRADIRDNP